MLKKYTITIPSNIKYIYSPEQKTLILIMNTNIKIYKLKLKLIINNDLRKIYITDVPFLLSSKKDSKNIKAYRGTEVSNIKQIVNQLSVINYKRLNLVGVGYRVFLQKSNKKTFLNLKLGYSHSIILKVPDEINIIYPKPNVIFISSYNLNLLNKIIGLIRVLRKPEPYKGKGVLYEYEKIVLKEGKKS